MNTPASHLHQGWKSPRKRNMELMIHNNIIRNHGWRKRRKKSQFRKRSGWNYRFEIACKDGMRNSTHGDSTCMVLCNILAGATRYQGLKIPLWKISLAVWKCHWGSNKAGICVKYCLVLLWTDAAGFWVLSPVRAEPVVTRTHTDLSRREADTESNSKRCAFLNAQMKGCKCIVLFFLLGRENVMSLNYMFYCNQAALLW